MMKDTSGPAFPVALPSGESYQGHLPHDGMTLRDYFAAHAPSNPPAWFEPVMESPEPAFNSVRDEETLEFITTNEDEIQAWKVERYKQQAIQWPYAWADLILAARVKP